MYGDELIVDVGGKYGIVWNGELCPHRDCEDSSRCEEKQRCDDVEYADVLVVGGVEPSLC